MRLASYSILYYAILLSTIYYILYTIYYMLYTIYYRLYYILYCLSSYVGFHPREPHEELIQQLLQASWGWVSSGQPSELWELWGFGFRNFGASVWGGSTGKSEPES